MYHILVDDCDDGGARRHRFVRGDIIAYILANPHALMCWRANHRVIMHRVAKHNQAAITDDPIKLRRQLVLARFRALVWWKMSYLWSHQDAVYSEFWQAAETAQIPLEELWFDYKLFNKWWRKFLLG
jgi:hypothetical protein